MKWMVNGSSIFGQFGGHQFAYEKLERGETPDYNFFYTCNISIKRSFLGKNPFDDRFSKYGWEDIELGYRLEKEKGLKMIYNPAALAYHHHAMDESGLAKRMEMIGRSAHIIDAKYPELRKVPPIWKRFIFVLLSNGLSLFLIRLLNFLGHGRFQPLFYYALSKKYFLIGLRDGKLLKKN
jgi:GT2 family glycosyltransferase